MSLQPSTMAAGGTRHGVQPTLAELIGLRRLVQAWPPPQRAGGSQAGAGSAPTRGRGMDYAESRPYTLGDDARHIDWRVTARTGRMHTKIFHAERDRVTLLLADTAPTQYFGTRVCFKSVQAARVGALAAWAALRSGDRVAALRGSHAEAPLAPTGGSRGVLRVLDALVRWYAAPPPGDLGLEVALQATQRLLKPGARLLALLDPRSVAAVADARWTALSAHHDALAVLLADPLELAPPAARLAFARGAGQGAAAAALELDLADPRARARWQQEFGARFEDAQRSLQRQGWRVLALRTDESPERVLRALLPQRREAA